MRFASFGSMKERRMVMLQHSNLGAPSSAEALVVSNFDVLKSFVGPDLQNAELVRIGMIQGAVRVNLLTPEAADDIRGKRADTFESEYRKGLERGQDAPSLAVRLLVRLYGPEIVAQNHLNLGDKEKRTKIAGIVGALVGPNVDVQNGVITDLNAISATKTAMDLSRGTELKRRKGELESEVPADKDKITKFEGAQIIIGQSEQGISGSLKDVYWETNLEDVVRRSNEFLLSLCNARDYLLDEKKLDHTAREMTIVVDLIHEFDDLLRSDTLDDQTWSNFFRSPLIHDLEWTAGLKLEPADLDHLQKEIRGLRRLRGDELHEVRYPKPDEYLSGIENDSRNVFYSFGNVLTALDGSGVYADCPDALKGRIDEFRDYLDVLEDGLFDADPHNPHYAELVAYFAHTYTPLMDDVKSFLETEIQRLTSGVSAKEQEIGEIEAQELNLGAEYAGTPLVNALMETRGVNVAAAEKEVAKADDLLKKATEAKEKFDRDEKAKVAAAKALVDAVEPLVAAGDLTALAEYLGFGDEVTGLAAAEKDVEDKESNLQLFQVTEGVKVDAAKAKFENGTRDLHTFTTSTKDRVTALTSLLASFGLSAEGSRIALLVKDVADAEAAVSSLRATEEPKVMVLKEKAERLKVNLEARMRAIEGYLARTNPDHIALENRVRIETDEQKNAEQGRDAIISEIGVPEIQKIIDELINKEASPTDLLKFLKDNPNILTNLNQLATGAAPGSNVQRLLAHMSMHVFGLENQISDPLIARKLDPEIGKVSLGSPEHTFLLACKHALELELTEDMNDSPAVKKIAELAAATARLDEVNQALTRLREFFEQVKRGYHIDTIGLRAELLQTSKDLEDAADPSLNQDLALRSQVNEFRRAIEGLPKDLAPPAGGVSEEAPEFVQRMNALLASSIVALKTTYQTSSADLQSRISGKQDHITGANEALDKEISGLQATVEGEVKIAGEEYDQAQKAYDTGVAGLSAAVTAAQESFDTAKQALTDMTTQAVKNLKADHENAEMQHTQGLAPLNESEAKAKTVKAKRDSALKLLNAQPIELELLKRAGYPVVIDGDAVLLFGYRVDELDKDTIDAILKELKAMRDAVSANRANKFKSVSEPAELLATVIPDLLAQIRSPEINPTLRGKIESNSLSASAEQIQMYIDTELASLKHNPGDKGISDKLGGLKSLKGKLEKAEKAAILLHEKLGELFGHFELAERIGLAEYLPSNLTELRVSYGGLSAGSLRLGNIEELRKLYRDLRGYLADNSKTAQLVKGVNNARMQMETVGKGDGVHEGIRTAMVALLHPDMDMAGQGKLASDSLKVDRALAALDPNGGEWVESMSAKKLDALGKLSFAKLLERIDIQRGGGFVALKKVIANPKLIENPATLRALMQNPALGYEVWAAFYVAFREVSGGALPLQCAIIAEEMEEKILKEKASNPSKPKLPEHKRHRKAKELVRKLIEEQEIGGVVTFLNTFEKETAEEKKDKARVIAIKRRQTVLKAKDPTFRRRQFNDEMLGTKAENDDMETDTDFDLPDDLFGFQAERVKAFGGDWAEERGQAMAETAAIETPKAAIRAALGLPLWAVNKIFGTNLKLPEVISDMVKSNVKGRYQTALERAKASHNHDVEKANLEAELAKLQKKLEKDPERVQIAKSGIDIQTFFTADFEEPAVAAAA